MRVCREEHLTPVPRRQHPAGSIENGSEVVTRPGFDLSDVDRHSHQQGTRLRPLGRCEAELDLLGRRQRGSDICEGGIDPIADALDDPAPCRLHGTAHDLVVALDRRSHRGCLHLPQHRRVLDVGEQEGERLDLRLSLEEERGVVIQDPVLQLPKLRRGIEPELLDEICACLLKSAQGLRLPPRSVQGEHVLGTQPLPERKLRAQHAQLCDNLGVMTHGELRLDPRLDGPEP